jgi:DUF4097 and DUF4098 domain-containing protein YvlB
MSTTRSLMIVVACHAVATAASAQQAIHRTVDAMATGSVRIELHEGDVTISGWDEARIEVSGELGRQAQSLVVEQQGAETLVRVVEAENVDGDGSETALYVSVPRSSSVAVMGTNADVLLTNVAGSLSLHTVAGDIEAESSGAAIEAETVGGDIRITGRGASADATLTTVAGEIEVGGPFSRINASTVSGDIELDVLETRELLLNATNGDIEVHATFAQTAELNAETINGDVELEVGEAGNLNIDAGSFSGRIRTCFDAPADADAATEAERRGRDRRRGGGTLTLTASADSPTVRVRTLNGDIEICSS